MKIILASQSPRRRELLAQMGITFDVVVKEVEESFPNHFDSLAAVRHIAEKKAKAFMDDTYEELVITADTIVTIDRDILGKPADEAHAVEILRRLSGRNHQVITAIALLHRGEIDILHEVTEVYFRELTMAEIEYYIQTGKPFDKAGAYGIQDWLGIVAIEKIEGSYTNVVGLPTARLHKELQARYLV